jgi:hypothetical protein
VRHSPEWVELSLPIAEANRKLRHRRMQRTFPWASNVSLAPLKIRIALDCLRFCGKLMSWHAAGKVGIVNLPGFG